MAKVRRRTQKRSNQPPRFWWILVFVVIASAVFVAVKLRIPSLLRLPSVTQQVAADTTLSFAADTIMGKVGETKTLGMMIASGKNTVTGAEFQLSLDSSVARLQKASAGTFFDKPTVLANVISNSGGSLHFAIGSLTPKQGNGTVATLTMRLVKPGSTTLSFSDVKIAAIGAGSTNVSRSASPVTITVTKQ
ncbi:hypothetical protein HY086_01000 [Candidatus Gottesmanbacteria bacterium]|nr:hypothetical protein [Candidatus Gottesmanbacteria bacterium]